MTGQCDSVLGPCQTPGYDDLNRLTGVSSSGTSYSYSYDRWGNRTLAKGNSYSFNGANQQTNNSYDAAGNQTSDGAHSYTYDAEGKVLQVDGGTTASYTYDALDNRVRYTTSASDLESPYDLQGRRQSIWTYVGNHALTVRAFWDYGLLMHVAGGAPTFHHSNYLGTERLRTNAQGQVNTTATSGPFGEDLNTQTPDGANWDESHTQYTGQEHDTETNTEHFLYRQYASNLGSHNASRLCTVMGRFSPVFLLEAPRQVFRARGFGCARGACELLDNLQVLVRRSAVRSLYLISCRVMALSVFDPCRTTAMTT